MVKELLTKAPILVLPTKKEPLLLYITDTMQVVSAALVVEWEEVGHTLKVRCPVYFISEVLADSKTRYPQIQKLLYVVLVAKRPSSTPPSTRKHCVGTTAVGSRDEPSTSVTWFSASSRATRVITN
jgi:hypothetical protein